MANKVVSKNEIFINGTYYPVSRPVQSQLASIYPSKIVIGDTTRDSQLRSSVWATSDHRGGIGIERMQGPADADRAWWSTCQLRYRHHLVLGALANKTTTEITGGSTAITGEITMLAELATRIYASWGQAPYYYIKATDDWTTNGGTTGYGYLFDFATAETEGMIRPPVTPSVFELKNPKLNVMGRVH